VPESLDARPARGGLWLGEPDFDVDPAEAAEAANADTRERAAPGIAVHPPEGNAAEHLNIACGQQRLHLLPLPFDPAVYMPD
jgi:hypothetical protein